MRERDLKNNEELQDQDRSKLCLYVDRKWTDRGNDGEKKLHEEVLDWLLG